MKTKVATTLDTAWAVAHLPERAAEAHKGSFAKLLLFVGSARYPGAAQLCSLAALKSGAGYVYLSSEVGGATVAVLPEIIPQELKNPDCVVVGPGLESFDRFYAWKGDSAKIVVDASALRPEILDHCTQKKHAQVIATPHPGEAATLLGTTASEVQADRVGTVRALQARYPAVTAWVLKGASTLVADSRHLHVNTSGSVAMATAGQGDVLSGILAALWPEFSSPVEAAALAVFIHGYAADLLSTPEKLDRGVLPHEVAMSIPSTISKLKSLAATK